MRQGIKHYSCLLANSLQRSAPQWQWLHRTGIVLSLGISGLGPVSIGCLHTKLGISKSSHALSHTSPPVLAQDTEIRLLTTLLGWNNRKVIFHPRAVMSLVNKCLTKSCGKPRTAATQKWICQDRRQFLQSVQWRTKYLVNKYESSFSNDAAHKTSKWNDRSSLLTPTLEERKYSNAGLATPAYPKGDKLKNKGYLNGSSSYNKAHI